MVLLGVRPYQNADFNLGRETFMIPVVWEKDGWLRVDNENGLVNKEERLPKLPRYQTKPVCSSDNFESLQLHFRWNTIHPAQNPFYSLKERPGCLRLFLRPEVMHEICTPAFVGRRQQHKNFCLKAAMDFAPACKEEEAGLALIQDDRYHYTFTVTLEQEQRILKVKEVNNHKITVLGEMLLPENGRIYLTVSGDETGYHFYFGKDDQELLPVFLNAAPQLLSTLTNEGFTGTYLGMYATSNHQPSDNFADFDWVLYEGN